MAIETNISAVDVNSASYAAKTTVVGQEEVPTMSVAEMQTSVEYMPRNLLAPKINELVNAVNASYSKAEADAAINAKVLEIGTGDMSKAVYDASGAVQAAGGIAGYVSGQVSPVTKRVTTLENMKYVVLKLEANGWTGTGPYRQTVKITGMTKDWEPGVPAYMPMYNSDGSVNETGTFQALEQVAYIKLLESGNGTLTAVCPEEKPTVGLWLMVPGVVNSGLV